VTAAQPRTPRLTLGLPTYNGERFLAAALDALLAQTFADFTLIISDNASTDGTSAIAEAYARRDARIRYVRHCRNLGSAFNHNYLLEQAQGEYFKWVSDDDLYGPDLLQRCVDALDARPDVVLAHTWTAFIDDSGRAIREVHYPLHTDVPDVAERFRSLLYTPGGDDIYGVIRVTVLRKVRPVGSFHLADRTFVSELALHGPFANAPDHLYLRRDHEDRTERVATNLRQRCARLDPARANRWRHPTIRLLSEYLFAYACAIWRAPISLRDRLRSWGILVVWMLRHVNPLYKLRLLQSPDPAVQALGARSAAGRVWGRFGPARRGRPG
jgi:glycosyltransferase involved in cell wall biosynthesis